MKELLSYAMNMDDGGATLKELLTKPAARMSSLIIFESLKHGIKQIVDSLIVEARNNNRDHAVNILEQIKYSKRYANHVIEEIFSFKELDVISKETNFKERRLLDSPSSSSEDSDSRTKTRQKLKRYLKL